LTIVLSILKCLNVHSYDAKIVPRDQVKLDMNCWFNSKIYICVWYNTILLIHVKHL